MHLCFILRMYLFVEQIVISYVIDGCLVVQEWAWEVRVAGRWWV